MAKKAKVAHFLLNEHLVGSPPNEALVAAWREMGCEVDLYAPLRTMCAGPIEDGVSLYPIEYGWRSVASAASKVPWRRYDLFSGTTEDPIPMAATLATLARKPLVVLADEIRSGSNGGNRGRQWKSFCRWGMRRAAFTIVNDPVRVGLQREYAGLRPDARVLVYPSAFRVTPEPRSREEVRRTWGAMDGALVVAASGGLGFSSGLDWLLETLDVEPDLFAFVQQTNFSPVERYLMQRSRPEGRIHVQLKRLNWQDAWAEAAAADVGLAIYRQDGPQFQNMGVSSNRLCMFLAMGIPVITSRQPSFEFVEKYGCGLMVDDAAGLGEALRSLRGRLTEASKAAVACAERYIRAAERYGELKRALAKAMKGPCQNRWKAASMRRDSTPRS